MTAENDLVLIYLEEQPLIFARIEHITADVKPNWYHITLLMLQVPLQTVTWILRDAYIDGAEFTMNGKRMRLEKLPPPAPLEKAPNKSAKEPGAGKTSRKTGEKVVSLNDFKKKT